MQAIEEFTKKAADRQNLSFEEAQLMANTLASSSINSDAKEDFLIALSDKGETAVEVAAFASTFRSMAVNPSLSKWVNKAIDVCGTGGDGSNTFNISTTVAFIVAAAGVPVFKHGNRSITSKCGSADLIEALGIRLDVSHARLSTSLNELSFCFFFAPAFHPAFKEVIPVRKSLAQSGRRTIFNLLGPLINPGRPAYQLVGVYAQRWVNPIAEALDTIGLKAGLVANCTISKNLALDELSCAGQNHIAGFGRLKRLPGQLSLSEAELSSCELNSLEGGDVSTNVEILEAIFDGSYATVPQGLLDSILLNAGTALWISERTENLKTGVDLARNIIDSGRAKQWLQRARIFYS